MSTKIAPGEAFEPRQTYNTSDFTPVKDKSIPLSPKRQALLDDVVALYSCRPSIERVKRYTPDAVYDDQFGYANNRYKIAGQCENLGYEVTRNDPDMIEFKNQQKWTFAILQKTATIDSMVTLKLDPETVDQDFIRIKYHKDQANEKDYSHQGLGFNFKKWQADNVPKYINSEEVKYPEKNKDAATQPPNKE
ncbi:hypothetical protein ISF_09918 [Cordyceps fumosorosea ARSEF 2679]|uniref:Uncharacterized protein n=1 Tax=Cordyceps fumosorosea (strain ARSEF 2679) TaxID=1081104 RepID=A0A166Z2S8_CORFA|nr:hypothetical protein ISF_09918 [Cordyceps fumosorosea ARSEF 2679]OAA37493.1 hypothetical protein ISF_09918 [Cordyceps fumosorosea ARSEF 2679]